MLFDIFFNLKNAFWVLVICSISLYFYAKWERGYYKRRGVKNVPFNLVFIGNCLSILTQSKHMKDVAQEIYDAFPDQKYVGYKQINRHLFMVRDPDILKQITVKDFDHFTNHLITVDYDIDKLFGSVLFMLKGEKWRDMRATLSPAFTSSKMRNMFPFIIEIGEQMVDYYTKKISENEFQERGLIEFEMRDAFTRYANDVIATTAFGIRVDSLTNRNNKFYEKGIDATTFRGWRQIKFQIAASFPFLKIFGEMAVFPEHLKQFFRDLVLNTMKSRKEEGIVRHDMIHLLMQAKEGSLQHESGMDADVGFATVQESQVGQRTVRRQWTDDDIVAQALLFFIAGFDSASTLLCFLIHELAVNPEIQKRLQEEVDDVIQRNGGTLTYENASKMIYMDMVVSETLRKWPPGVVMDRECVKDYELPPVSNDSQKPVTVCRTLSLESYMIVSDCDHVKIRPDKIRKGEGIWMPIYAIHHDPKYYPNPEKFDPSRFSEENKHTIKPLTYLPFGAGPRNCIGSRFALMETKSILFQLLAKFDFVPTAKTQNPIKLSKKTFNLLAENGFWIGLKPRS